MENQSQQTLSRNFKGIWIPREIWIDKRLSYFEKCLLSEIHSLDDEEKGCFASNQYFMDFFGENERTIQRGLANLKKLKYITYENFDGRTRALRSNLYPKENNPVTSEVTNLSPLPCQICHPCSREDSIEPDNKAYNKDIRRTPPIPPKGGTASDDARVRVFGKFVKMSEEEFQKLCKTYGPHTVEGLIEEINDYLSSTGKKPYKDYPAAVRQWARRRSLIPASPQENPSPKLQEEKEPESLTPAQENSQWFEAIRKKNKSVSNLQNQMRLMYGNGHIEFTDIQDAKFYYGEHGFRDKVENTLRKLNIYLSKED